MALMDPFLVMAKPAGPVCNLACGYCYYLPKRALFPPGEQFRMKPAILAAYISSYISSSPGPIVHFVWHGGEPTVAGLDFYRQVLALQTKYLPKGWQCVNNLQTNGTLLDEKWCRFLAENRFTVGLSIDGPAHIHNACRPDRRNRPTHDRVMRGLGLLRSSGIEPDVLCTLTSISAKEPQTVYRFFIDIGVKWVQFLPVVERRPDNAVSALSVAPDLMGSFLTTVFDEWVRYDVGRIGVQNFLECLLVMDGRPANLCIMSETCGAVLAIEHDGSVYSCDHFVSPEHRLGNVADDSLAGLLTSAAQTSFGLGKRDTLPEECRTCSVRKLCNGGCPKDRFAPASDGARSLNYLCAGYREFYVHVQPLLSQMVDLAHSGQPITTIMKRLEIQEHTDRHRWNATGRNDPCPCGSGRKYKHCCLGQRRN